VVEVVARCFGVLARCSAFLAFLAVVLECGDFFGATVVAIAAGGAEVGRLLGAPAEQPLASSTTKAAATVIGRMIIIAFFGSDEPEDAERHQPPNEVGDHGDASQDETSDGPTLADVAQSHGPAHADRPEDDGEDAGQQR
jgi:hypothetical protein